MSSSDKPKTSSPWVGRFTHASSYPARVSNLDALPPLPKSRTGWGPRRACLTGTLTTVLGGGIAVLSRFVYVPPTDIPPHMKGALLRMDETLGTWEAQATVGLSDSVSKSATRRMFADKGASKRFAPCTQSHLPFVPVTANVSPSPWSMASVLRQALRTSPGTTVSAITFAKARANVETSRQASAVAPTGDKFLIRNVSKRVVNGVAALPLPIRSGLIQPLGKWRRVTGNRELPASSPRATQSAHLPYLAVTRALQPATWNGISTDWGSSGNWSNGVVPGNNAKATFINTGSTTVSLLNTPQSVGGISFATDAQAFTIDGNYSLTLGSEGIVQNSPTDRQTISTTGGVVLGVDQTWNVARGGLTVSSPISGVYGLTKTGIGELTLAGSNLFTGGIALRAGTLTLAVTGAGGSGPLALANNAVFGTAGSDVILNLNAMNAFSNQTAFALQGSKGSNGYRIEFSGSDSFVVLPGSNGGSLTMNVSAASALGQDFTQLSLSGGNGGDAYAGRGGVASGGPGGSVTLNLLAANALSDQTDLILARGTNGSSGTRNGQTLPGGQGGGVIVNLNGIDQHLGGLNSAAATNLIVQNNGAADATLSVGDSTDHSFGGILRNGAGGGTLALVKEGIGALTLTGANTFTGGTRLNAGTLVARGTGLSNGTVTVGKDATLSVGSAVNTMTSSQATGTLTLSSLVLTPGSSTPQLTFNLGVGGSSDTLILTRGDGALTSSSSGVFLFGFGSAGGDPLPVSGTYHLLTFTTPQSVNALPTLSQYRAMGVGNAANRQLGDAFTYQMLNGQITGLNYTMSGAVVPEPSTLSLMAGILFSGTLLVSRARYPVVFSTKLRDDSDRRGSE